MAHGQAFPHTGTLPPPVIEEIDTVTHQNMILFTNQVTLEKRRIACSEYQVELYFLLSHCGTLTIGVVNNDLIQYIWYHFTLLCFLSRNV